MRTSLITPSMLLTTTVQTMVQLLACGKLAEDSSLQLPRSLPSSDQVLSLAALNQLH